MSLEHQSSFFPMVQSTDIAQQVTVTNNDSRNDQSQSISEQTYSLPSADLPIIVTPIRKTHHVLTHAQRYKIVVFMVEDAAVNGDAGICARAIKRFPQFFRGKCNTFFTRAKRCWNNREGIISQYRASCKRGSGHYYSVATSERVKTLACKVGDGRERKRSAWCTTLYTHLLKEFERLRHAGVRFNRLLLKVIAKRIIMNGHSTFYGPSARDEKSNKLIVEHITIRWIQSFMQNNNIVCRIQSGKLSVSPAKQELIEREVAFHLGKLEREFSSGTLDEDCVVNYDETRFVFNMHNFKTLAMRGDDHVKYADVISGTDSMTMMVTLSGGSCSMISPAFLIFQNDNSSYPIRGLPDNIPGVAYRSGPKRWIDAKVFKDWLTERRVLGPLPNGKKRVLFMDNCGGHKIDEEVVDILKVINSEIRFFPKNATDLCQPAYSFIIQKLKTAWRRKWDEKNLQLLEQGMWGSAIQGSGKLANPGKQYFMKLAADVVRELNDMRDELKVLYSRKAMIKCGLSKNLNGGWEVEQLFPHLQAIIAKYREHFDGTPVRPDIDLDGKRTESEAE